MMTIHSSSRTLQPWLWPLWHHGNMLRENHGVPGGYVPRRRIISLLFPVRHHPVPLRLPQMLIHLHDTIHAERSKLLFLANHGKKLFGIFCKLKECLTSMMMILSYSWSRTLLIMLDINTVDHLDPFDVPLTTPTGSTTYALSGKT